MKLYYVPRTRAVRVRWVLEELGLPYELVRLDPQKGETRTPEHLARQPLGHVPALEDGDVRMFESAAICLWIAETHGGEKLLGPAGSAERAAVYQWLFYATTELEPALGTLAGATWGKPEAEWDLPRAERARRRLGVAFAAVEAALADGRPFVAGARFTIADVLLGSLIGFARAMRAGPESPHLAAYFARLRARPAYVTAARD